MKEPNYRCESTLEEDLRLTSFSSCSLSVTSLLERCLRGGKTRRLKGEPLSMLNPPPLNSTSLDRRRGNLVIPPRTNPMSEDKTDEDNEVAQSSPWWLLPYCPFSSSDSRDCARRGGHSAIRARTPILGTETRGCMAGSVGPGTRWPLGVWRNGVCWGNPPPPPPSRRSEEVQVTPLSL